MRGLGRSIYPSRSSRSSLVRDVKLLARVDLAGVAADRRLVGIIDLGDVGFRAAAVKLLGDRGQAVPRLDGVAGSLWRLF